MLIDFAGRDQLRSWSRPRYPLSLWNLTEGGGVTGGRILTGSCLCGLIGFAVSGPLGKALNCHCSICRKAHAAAFRSRVSVAAEQFAWTAGEGDILWYESSPGTHRGFCGRCGTRLVSRIDATPESLGVPLALFDDDPGIRPACHVHVASKAPWFEISDELPQVR